MTGTTCTNCGAALSDARLVIDGGWWCPDCVYEREAGPAKRKPARRNGAPAQTETLFPLPPRRRRDR